MSRNAMTQCIEDVNREAEQRETRRQEWLAEVAARQAERSESLAEAMPKEMARVRVVLGHYREIGPAGTFGAHFIEADLAEADRAVMSGDVVRMIQAYQKLKEIKE